MHMKLFFPKTLSAVLGIGILLTGLALHVQAEPEKSTKRIFTKHFQETLFDISKNAEFSIEILLDDKEYKIGKNVIGIVLHKPSIRMWKKRPSPSISGTVIPAAHQPRPLW